MTVETLTVREAALVSGFCLRQVAELARRGRVEAVMVDGWWLVDGASLRAYVALPPSERRGGRGRVYRYVPAGPLLRQIDLAGGAAAVGVGQNSAEEMAIARARISGRLTEEMADHLAVKLLGLTPWELWDIAG